MVLQGDPRRVAQDCQVEGVLLAAGIGGAAGGELRWAAQAVGVDPRVAAQRGQVGGGPIARGEPHGAMKLGHVSGSWIARGDSGS